MCDFDEMMMMLDDDADDDDDDDKGHTDVKTASFNKCNGDANKMNDITDSTIKFKNTSKSEENRDIKKSAKHEPSKEKPKGL